MAKNKLNDYIKKTTREQRPVASIAVRLDADLVAQVKQLLAKKQIKLTHLVRAAFQKFIDENQA